MRNAFRTALLNLLEEKLGPSFKSVKSKCYEEHKEGFYIYARHNDNDKTLHLAIPKEKHKIFKSFTEWRTAILSFFGYDPLKCPYCGATMSFLELYFNHKRVSLEQLYEEAKSKAHGIRPHISA